MTSWRKRAKDLVAARFRSVPSSTHLTGTPDARELCLLTGRFHFDYPVERVVWSGAFRFGPWHPWVRALTHGREELERYYQGFLPSTVGGRYLLDLDEPGLDREPLDPVPWWRRAQADPAEGLAYERRERQKYLGPTDPDKVEEEWRRLCAIRSSIEEHGYRPQENDGHLRGFFLLADGEERLVISAGQHRLAALVALGWDEVPFTFQPTFPRSISVEDVAHFPGVRAGEYSEAAAAAVFRQHFVLDGSQQYATFLPDGTATRPAGAGAP